MIDASTVFRGHAAWLIFRQAEPLYTLGFYQVACLTHRKADSPREIAVFNRATETLVLLGPNAIVAAARKAGIEEPQAEPDATPEVG
jgi:hypothetical protein